MCPSGTVFATILRGWATPLWACPRRSTTRTWSMGSRTTWRSGWRRTFCISFRGSSYATAPTSSSSRKVKLNGTQQFKCERNNTRSKCELISWLSKDKSKCWLAPEHLLKSELSPQTWESKYLFAQDKQPLLIGWFFVFLKVFIQMLLPVFQFELCCIYPATLSVAEGALSAPAIFNLAWLKTRSAGQPSLI